jgi:hypothetical protein
MAVAKILEAMRRGAAVRSDDLCCVCEHYFGAPRTSGSHHIYRTPWAGDPRVNIQRSKDGQAKRYQVKQVLAAIAKFESEK